jgi:hypothetical protein
MKHFSAILIFKGVEKSMARLFENKDADGKEGFMLFRHG